MVPWGPKAHLVEAFKFAVYLAVPVTLTVAVAQNDRNLFGLIDHFQYIKYPKGKAVTREEIDTAASVMIEELKANKAARRKAQLAEAAPGAVGGGAVVAAEGKRRFW